MFKGKFKTAYDQREIPVDIVVAGAADLKVGQLVTLEPADEDAPEYIYPATGADAATVLTNATHIIAQSDMTMEYGHVPVENRDYKYSDVVKRSNTDGAATTVEAVSNTSEKKKVALFAISDKTDIIVYEA